VVGRRFAVGRFEPDWLPCVLDLVVLRVLVDRLVAGFFPVALEPPVALEDERAEC
jgi:hypothetical protein